MFKDTAAFSGFAVDDLDAARTFYTDVLGLDVAGMTEVPGGLLQLNIAGGHPVMVYPKPDFAPATYTILNFPVDDIDRAVDELTARGVRFERYDGFEQDEKGIQRGEEGPLIAWFTDPAGNVLSVLQDRRSERTSSDRPRRGATISRDSARLEFHRLARAAGLEGGGHPRSSRPGAVSPACRGAASRPIPCRNQGWKTD